MKPPFFNSRLDFAWVFLALGFYFAGCSSSSMTDPKNPPAPAPNSETRKPVLNLAKDPKSEKGVRVTHAGEAVAEVEFAPDPLFEAAENYLRDHYKVTFVNRTLRQIEAETKTHLFVVKVTVLTTGGTALCVTVTQREDQRSEPNIARQVAEDILSAVESSPKK